jgi:pimeloyl-ACP methyl ester carboxylesterase
MRRILLGLCLLCLTPAAWAAPPVAAVASSAAVSVTRSANQPAAPSDAPPDESSGGWLDSIKGCWRATRDYIASVPGRTRARVRAWAKKSDEGRPLPARLRPGFVCSESFNGRRPVVVLIHGLDSGTGYWDDLAPLVEGAGYAVARLNYPNDQPLAESATVLAREVAALRSRHPRVSIDIVAHSMGAMIARAYVEGDDYPGGVRRLIMLAPPNHGSCYSRFSLPTEFIEHADLWYHDSDWRWTWWVHDGLGEARNDLTPGSDFLAGLNARPRRAGVKYTIVAGNRSCGWRYTANAMRGAAEWLPDWQWTRAAEQRVVSLAGKVEGQTGGSDGLVWLDSVRLEGVDDFVLVPADHTTIACSANGCEPVAWPTIAARLKRPSAKGND